MLKRFLFLFLFILVNCSAYSKNLDLLFGQACSCNNSFLYEDAINFLNQIINKSPDYSIEIYKERAISYFELGEIDLALQDYNKIIEKVRAPLKNDQFFSSIDLQFIEAQDSNHLDFATGLLQGTWEGSKEETIEFVSSLRGSLSFLWAFTCSPIEVSKDMVHALRDIGNFLTSTNIDDLLEVGLPELIECRTFWNT